MSEITRFDVDGREWELLEVGEGDYVRHADHLIYLREMRMDRDVERLRADTAEAELKELRDDFTEQLQDLKRDRQKAWDARDAAEQRIADLLDLLKRIDRTPLDRWYRDGLNVAVFAALNPNPEAESHE